MKESATESMSAPFSLLQSSILGLTGTVHVHHLQPWQRNSNVAHRSIQRVAQCATRKAQGHREGCQHATQCQSVVSPFEFLSRDELSRRFRFRIDDIEDDAQLRRGAPGELPSSCNLCPGEFTPRQQPAVAHKIFGVPQTINTANYIYFLAYQELFSLRTQNESSVASQPRLISDQHLDRTMTGACN
jgi:hypothetical protein